jgi:hypothetical protein
MKKTFQSRLDISKLMHPFTLIRNTNLPLSKSLKSQEGRNLQHPKQKLFQSLQNRTVKDYFA